MEGISEYVTKAAEDFAQNEDRIIEGETIRSLLQGLVVGDVMHKMKEIIAIASVHQDMDEHGNYLPYFDVNTKAGHKFRITVERLP